MAKLLKNYQSASNSSTVIIFVAVILFLFSGIALIANLIHRQNINNFEQLGQIYSGPITDNYYFEAPEYGTKYGKTRTKFMICFKPETPPENVDLLCSTEFVSKSFAAKYPIGSPISAYYRSDINDLLLIPAIEHWRNNWFFQTLFPGIFILGLLMFIYVKFFKK